MLNNSLVWVLESNINTSLFYSNVNVTNDTFTTYKYITTSNIVEDSDFNFGQLNYGWNLCSFELFYEKVSGNPILSIKAYNAQSGQIGLNGNFSGQVKIPKIVTTGPLDGVSKIINAISSVTGHFLEKIPGISSIYDAISAGSSIIGKINAFTSKSKVVYVDAKTSGNIELDGVLMVSLGGAVSHLNDLNLKRLNNNKELGVWTLNDNLVLNYNTCNEALPLNSSELRTTVKHWLDNGLINKIVINPDIIDQIQSYRIVGYDILLKNSDENFNNQKLAEYCYRTNMQSEFLGDVSSFYAENYNKLCTVVKKTMLLPSELYVNLNIEIIYKDGSKFLSSRNYKPIINAVDNYQFYLEESMKPNRAILFL